MPTWSLTAPTERAYWGVTAKKEKKKKSKIPKGIAWHEEPEILTLEEPYGLSTFNCRKDRVWSEFQRKADVRTRAVWEPRQNEEPCEDYTHVFLSHAQLYVFSDRYSIEPLQELSMQKLRLVKIPSVRRKGFGCY